MPVCVGGHEGQMRVLGFLELELQVVLSVCVQVPLKLKRVLGALEWGRGIGRVALYSFRGFLKPLSCLLPELKEHSCRMEYIYYRSLEHPMYWLGIVE